MEENTEKLLKIIQPTLYMFIGFLIVSMYLAVLFAYVSSTGGILMKWRNLNNNRGFTLIEMMIVLLVISVLLIITIPNVTKHNSKINSKGCDAFVKMVQAQVQAYEIDKKALPSNIQDLVVRRISQ